MFTKTKLFQIRSYLRKAFDLNIENVVDPNGRYNIRRMIVDGEKNWFKYLDENKIIDLGKLHEEELVNFAQDYIVVKFEVARYYDSKVKEGENYEFNGNVAYIVDPVTKYQSMASTCNPVLVLGVPKKFAEKIYSLGTFENN